MALPIFSWIGGNRARSFDMYLMSLQPAPAASTTVGFSVDLFKCPLWRPGQERRSVTDVPRPRSRAGAGRPAAAHDMRVEVVPALMRIPATRPSETSMAPSGKRLDRQPLPAMESFRASRAHRASKLCPAEALINSRPAMSNPSTKCSPNSGAVSP